MPKKIYLSPSALAEEPTQSTQDDVSSLSELEMITSDTEDEASVKEGKTLSEQDKRAADDLSERKMKQNDEFMNKLNHIRKNPELWESEDNKYLQEFVNHIECNRVIFLVFRGMMALKRW